MASGPGGDTAGFALADLPVVGLSDAPARAGAYAVRDTFGVVRYMGYSKDVQRKVRMHVAAVGDDRAAAVQVYAPDGGEVGADILEAVLEYWVQENGGVVPDGNAVGEERALWEGGGVTGPDGRERTAVEQREVLMRNIYAFLLLSSVLKTAQYLFMPY
jgi:hypothetical protein